MSKRQQYINESFRFVAILENSGDFIFAQGGLTVKTYSVLYLISTGMNTSKDLLNGMYGSKPNMAKKLKFLEENGFIQRKIDNSDKRVFRFSITKKAENAINKILPLYENAISLIFEGIDDKELECGLGTLEKCMKNFNMCNPKNFNF